MRKNPLFNGSKGIFFDSGSLIPEDQACPGCSGDFEYHLVVMRRCKSAGKYIDENPWPKEFKDAAEFFKPVAFCTTEWETLVEFPLEKGMRYLNNIGIK